MPTAHLPKKFGLLNAVSINMSNMVGTGPFITVPAIVATMGGPQALLCWFVGAAIAIADGLVFAELGTTFPSSGGSYTYLRECFGRESLGRLMAWLFVWQFLFSGTLEIATGTVGMALYSGFLFKGLVSHPWAMRLLAAGFSLLSMVLLYRKIGDIARIMLALWTCLLLTSLWVVIAGLTHLNTRMLFDFPPGAFHLNLAFLLGLGNGSMLVMYNFLGYYNICNLGDEVRDPGRVIPRAIIGSILLVLLLDLGISVAFTGVLPWREMIVPGTVIYEAVGSVFMQRIGGFWAAQWLTIMVLITAFASVYSLMLGYSRIPYAAALDGTFFRYFGKVHAQKDFPHRSLLLVGIVSAIASLFDLVQIITALLMARILIMFVGQIIGLLLLRKRHPEVPRPFRMWLYPLPALFAMACWLYIFLVQVFEPGGWVYILYVLAVVVSGVGLYLWLARRQRYWPYVSQSG
ncbi:MAG TPA: APC family permease [Acidobacteriaceae bacterium]|nr:APC family permease [Acidobacteriaceae bacterium]